MERTFSVFLRFKAKKALVGVEGIGCGGLLVVMLQERIIVMNRSRMVTLQGGFLVWE